MFRSLISIFCFMFFTTSPLRASSSELEVMLAERCFYLFKETNEKDLELMLDLMDLRKDKTEKMIFIYDATGTLDEKGENKVYRVKNIKELQLKLIPIKLSKKFDFSRVEEKELVSEDKEAVKELNKLFKTMNPENQFILYYHHKDKHFYIRLTIS